MPIYEYRCTQCRDEFEISQKITDEPLKECPKCKGATEKLISQSSFVLKGSGWYKTDYAQKTPPSKNKEKSVDGPACAASGSKPACSGCPSAAD